MVGLLRAAAIGAMLGVGILLSVLAVAALFGTFIRLVIFFAGIQ